jgi:hypothetical protein
MGNCRNRTENFEHCRRVGGQLWTATTSFTCWTARAGQQGHRALRHSGMIKQLWLKRGRRLSTRRLRFGRATAVWRPYCICRRPPEFILSSRTTLSAAIDLRIGQGKSPGVGRSSLSLASHNLIGERQIRLAMSAPGRLADRPLGSPDVRHSCRQPVARAPRFCKATSMVPCCPGGEHATSRRGRARIIVMPTVEVEVAVSVVPRRCGCARKHSRGREH